MKRILRCAVYLLIVPNTDCAFGSDLPTATSQLVEKLESFEAEEKAKLEALIQEKRSAVLDILKQQAEDETRKGNPNGALAIRNKIIELGGEVEEPVMQESGNQAAVGWEIPDDAELYRGDYYKVYPLASPITWEEARARCKAVGGEIGWIDRNEDIAELKKWMQPVVDKHGHAPIWMGATKQSDGTWEWINGEEVQSNFWNSDSDAISGPNDTAMIRWMGSFKGANPESARIIGYLCRWKR